MSKGFNSKVDMGIELEDVKEISSEILKMSKEIQSAVRGQGLYDSRDTNTEPNLQQYKQLEDMWLKDLKDIHDREDFKVEKEFEDTLKDNGKNETKHEHDYDYER